MRREFWFVGLAAVGVVGVLNAIVTNDSTSMERFLASVIILVSFVPVFQYVAREEKGMPFFPLFGGIYAVTYAVPVFLLESFEFKEWTFPHPLVEKGLLSILAGLVSLLAAAYWTALFKKDRLIPRFSLILDAEKTKPLLILLGLIGLIATYYPIAANIQEGQELPQVPLVLQQIVFLVANLSLLSISMMFVFQLQGRLGTFYKIILWGLFLPLQIFLDLSTGTAYRVLRDIAPLTMIYWGTKRRIPWAAILIGLALFVLIRGNSVEFRGLTLDPEYQGISVFERSGLFITVIAENTREGGVMDAYERTRDRVSHLNTLVDVMEQTPRVVPYWHGETYLTLLTSIIPRVLWPDKPTKTVGQSFGHRYGRIGEEDIATSENLPQMVEMYANFGLPGIIIGMFLMGLIYRVIYLMLNHPAAGEGCLAVSVVIFTYLLNIESDFSLTFGAVIQQILILYLLLRPLRAKEPSPAACA